MSDSKVPFHVRTPDAPAGIELLDARRKTVVAGVGEIHTEVPAGLYRLRVSTGAHADETIIAVDLAGYTDLDLPTRVLSAAPVFGTRASHEFHAYGVHDLLRRGPGHRFGSGGGVVVFARNLATDDMPGYKARIQEHVPIEQLSLARLHPNSGETDVLFEHGGPSVAQHEQGWAGVFVEVDPGPYVLRWSRPRVHPTGRWRTPHRIIDQSLVVSLGWITFLFIGNRPDTGLMRANASIHMGRMGVGVHAWQVSEPGALATEVVLSGLRRGESLVGRDTVDLLLHSKFRNPMLGLLGAHALLSERVLRAKMLKEVLHNLSDLLGVSQPDYQALCVRAHARGFEEANVGEVRAPPMLHASYRALIEADPSHAGLLVEDGAAELIASRLRSETPWTTWVPFEEHHSADVEDAKVESAVEIALSTYQPTRRIGHGVVRALRRALSSPEVNRVAQWLEYARGRGLDPVELGAAEVASRVGLPVATTRRALRWLERATTQAEDDGETRTNADPREHDPRREVLVIRAQVRRLIRRAGLRAGAGLSRFISNEAHRMLEDAIARAKANGRATVRPYDL